MATELLVPQPPPPEGLSPVRPPQAALRVEYVGFQDVQEHREFRFRVYGLDRSGEFRIRVASDAFDSRKISRQDCPDLCYQVLLGAIHAESTPLPEVITIGDADLVGYRQDHTPVPRRRARPAGWEPKPAAEPRKAWQYRASPRKPPVAPPPPAIPAEVVPAFAQGQRVLHAVFGLGVTMATSSERTVVSFDQGGARSFVTSLLELQSLSAPGAWEINRSGTARPCRPAVG